ncbi:Aste57867_14583 [Aphanomyces stellatus]|uniref:Aste57867_14583 protein n=1 Tax=Aphanomyces stellatus TaxID=120398 RepID=A0A485L117_9STRA|nr:hypothetical protein As57867_014529 [Aphanomyces stellatus]VFT91402.1 Aste57867_14583 [Aphanomyces stellatus]
MAASSYQSVAVDDDAAARQQPGHHHETAGCFSRLSFAYAGPMLSLGHHRRLDPADMWPLEPANQCANVSVLFEAKFKQSRSILWSVVAAHGRDLLVVAFLQLVTLGGTLFAPVVLKQILEAIEGGEANGPFNLDLVLAYVAALVVAKLVQALASTHSNLKNQVLVARITSALQHLLFKKSLFLASKCRREKSAGEIANLFSSDIQWIISFAVTSNQVWLLPLQVLVTLTLLYNLIGWASLLGSAAIVVVLVINHFTAMHQKHVLTRLMELKDSRMKSINEVFGAMQIIKFNAWEEKFHDKITTQRTAELTSIWRLFALQAFQMAVLYVAPVAVTLSSFAAYTLLMHETLSATKMFTALSLFTLLRYPMTALPQVIASMLQAFVAVERFMEFLNLEERDESLVLTPDTAPASLLAQMDNIHLRIDGGSFGWTSDAPPLYRDWNMTVKRGELAVVSGAVGEGKSSLCSALLGEMDKTAGTVFVGGSVAYFSQQAWIQNMTVRENILFGKPYDRTKYNKVIEACALTKDLAAFPAGDRTEIGQKGVNVSGGQKARISLARACYSDADILILDSPLSAVDAIVQNEIFTKCFLGLLRHKTVLLVTHSPEILASKYIDRIIDLHMGCLVETVRDTDELPAPLVSPLRVSSGDWGDDANNAVEFPTTMTVGADVFLTPTVGSPYPPGFAGAVFTPVDPLQVQLDDDDAPLASTGGKLILEEARSEGRVSAAVFQDYLDAIGGWSTVAYWVFLLSSWQCLIISGDLWLSRWSATSATVSPDTFLAQAEYYLAVYTALALSGIVMTVIRTYTILMSCLRASRLLFEAMTSSLLRAPMRFFDTNPLGRLLNRFSNDMNTVDTQLPMLLSGMLALVAMTLFQLATALVAIRSMGLVIVPLLYVYYQIAAFYVHPARALERVNKTTKSPMLNLVSETIEGALVVRAFGPKQVRRFQRMHHRNVDANNEAFVAAQTITQWFSLRIQLLSACLLLVISLSLVFLRDALSPGVIGLVFTYLFSILPFFELIVNLWSMFETAMVGPERVSEYAHVEPEPPRVIAGAVAASWPTTGDVSFDHMSFRYKPSDPLVLKDVSVDIRSGENIGIVGRTGAGKSSLTMALFRVNDLAAGKIRIDGVDIATVGVKTLRSAIAIIPQSPVLFKGTLRNYLDPFAEFTDDALWESLRHVKLADRVASVDGALESPVEENGENFSVGERQMLCMARALLRRARIVVMDEATAAIDHETDHLLQQVIRTEFATSTVLTIAHRLDTVLDSNRILVFDQGRLVQCDTPAALIRQGTGIFFELCSEGGYLDKVVHQPKIKI